MKNFIYDSVIFILLLILIYLVVNKEYLVNNENLFMEQKRESVSNEKLFIEPKKIFISSFPKDKDKFQMSIPSLDGTLSAELFMSRGDLKKFGKDIEDALQAKE